MGSTFTKSQQTLAFHDDDSEGGGAYNRATVVVAPPRLVRPNQPLPSALPHLDDSIDLFDPRSPAYGRTPLKYAFTVADDVQSQAQQQQQQEQQQQQQQQQQSAVGGERKKSANSVVLEADEAKQHVPRRHAAVSPNNVSMSPLNEQLESERLQPRRLLADVEEADAAAEATTMPAAATTADALTIPPIDDMEVLKAALSGGARKPSLSASSSSSALHTPTKQPLTPSKIASALQRHPNSPVQSSRRFSLTAGENSPAIPSSPSRYH